MSSTANGHCLHRQITNEKLYLIVEKALKFNSSNTNSTCLQSSQISFSGENFEKYLTSITKY